MIFSNMKSVTIPEGVVTKIVAAGKTLWEAVRYKNQVPLSINESGGIYNGTGYKNGYRVRSGGAEGASQNNACTGYIKVGGGDIIRISGWNFGDAKTNCINVFNSSFTHLGQFSMQPATYGIFASGAAYESYGPASVVKEKDGVWKWIVPPAASGAAYIRVTAADYTNTPTVVGKDMIVTINEEIT